MGLYELSIVIASNHYQNYLELNIIFILVQDLSNIGLFGSRHNFLFSPSAYQPLLTPNINKLNKYSPTNATKQHNNYSEQGWKPETSL